MIGLPWASSAHIASMEKEAYSTMVTRPSFHQPQVAPRTRAWPMNTNKGLLLLRLVVGLLFAGHACQKLFAWFGGDGMVKFIGAIEKLGLHPAPLWANLEAWAELLGGLLLVFGWLTPVAAAALIGDMLVATIKVHATKGLWSQKGGFEYNLVLMTILFALGLIGPGIYSLDNRLPFRLPRPLTFLVALVVTAVVVSIGILGATPAMK
jgi:putative oxidoreductase